VRRKILLLLFFTTNALCCIATAAWIEKELALSEVPSNILAAATNAVSQIELEEASLIGEGVEAVYELEGVVDGTPFEIYVTPDGEILKVDQDDD
jgi:uncharacterized membrane protein YkoI